MYYGKTTLFVGGMLFLADKSKVTDDQNFLYFFFLLIPSSIIFYMCWN